MANEVYVSLEFTPNPNTLKYSVNRQLLDKGAVNFTKKDDADRRSPLASKLFGVSGISGVMIGRDFVTVTKTEQGDWDVVHKSSSTIIEQHLAKDETVLNAEAAAGASTDAHKGGTSAIENKIREILDNEIRPAVAMDGGDITFEKFENGVVYVYLQGILRGMPKFHGDAEDGHRDTLKDAIPEVTEVVAV